MNSKQSDGRMGVRDCLCWNSGTNDVLEGDKHELPLNVGSLETLKCDGNHSSGRESSFDVSDHVFLNCDGHMTSVKQETKSDELKVKKQQRRRLKIDENPEAIMVDIMRFEMKFLQSFTLCNIPCGVMTVAVNISQHAGSKL